MESIKKQLLKRILPLILSLVIIFTSSVYPEKRVKAEALTLTFVAVTVIAGIIISGLAASGAISGDYTVSAPDLSAIQEKAQANLQAAGANAVEQANRLGEAIKSGAESAKIKALASGAVIYAFLQAIQDVLFQHDTSVSMESLPDYNYIGNMSGCQIYVNAKDFPSDFALGPRKYYDDTQFKQYITFPSLKVQGERWMIYEVYAYNTETNLYWAGALGWVTRNDRYKFCASGNACKVVDNKYAIIALLPNVPLNYHGIEAEKISDASSITLPTILPSNIIENITKWDGTSDLVLAPPLPYDIPTGEDLVIDPSYVGEGTVDPPSPTTDPDNPPSEEEGITLPWLAALLSLLGLGKLTGIDEGVKSGIDHLVDSITSTAQNVYDGIRDWADTARSTIAQGIEGVRAKLGEIAGVITGGLALGIESIQSALGSIAETIGHAFDPPSKNVDWDKLKNIQLFNKFPFSIPSDLYYLFGLVAADPVAPCVKIPFDMTFLGGENIDATVDLATYDNVAAIIRSFEFIAFVIGMLYLTKSLIWK